MSNTENKVNIILFNFFNYKNSIVYYIIVIIFLIFWKCRLVILHHQMYGVIVCKPFYTSNIKYSQVSNIAIAFANEILKKI